MNYPTTNYTTAIIPALAAIPARRLSFPTQSISVLVAGLDTKKPSAASMSRHYKALAIIMTLPTLYVDLHYPFGAEGVYLPPANLLNKSPAPIIPIACSDGFATVEAACLQNHTADGVR